MLNGNDIILDRENLMESTALLILLALAQYVYFSVRVGAARDKYGVDAPRTTGDENWERLYRVQMNTLEQLIVFVPGMMLFASYASARWAWVPGILFIVGRQLYAMEYVKDPKTRVPGMALTLFANAALLGGGLIGVVMKMI
jgi:uncharacterized membrane protein YecN with MAPEG domain